LIHLRQALKGEASEAVSTLGDDDAAYQEAWRILRGRYGDLEVLKPLLLNELQDIPPTGDTHTVFSQRQMHDKIRSKFLKLLAIDKNIDKVDSPLLSLIQAKYARQVRREIEKEYGNRTTIMEFLDRAEAILRREGKYAATEQKRQREGPPARNPKDKMRNASAFSATKRGEKHKDSEPTPIVSVAQKKGGPKGKKKGDGKNKIKF